MNCAKAQRLFDDLARARLDEVLARQVREHLTDCTDCRVQHQRQAHLQRLLALKRYEQPPAAYPAGVVTEFHRRLAAAERRPTTWQQITASLGLDSFLEPGYGWAGLCASLLIVGLGWMGWQTLHESARDAQDPAPIVLTAVVPQPVVAELTVTPVALPLHSSPLSSAASVELVAAGQSQPRPPRYVLDRIAITPASYEMADVNF